MNISIEDDVIIIFPYLAQLSAFTKRVKNAYYVMLCLVCIAANEDPNKPLFQNVKKKGLDIHFPPSYCKGPKESYFFHLRYFVSIDKKHNDLISFLNGKAPT